MQELYKNVKHKLFGEKNGRCIIHFEYTLFQNIQFASSFVGFPRVLLNNKADKLLGYNSTLIKFKKFIFQQIETQESSIHI